VIEPRYLAPGRTGNRKKVPSASQIFASQASGTTASFFPFLIRGEEELSMPVLLLWAVPAVIIVGGVGYFLVHVH
jgi:hypothetical protein